MKNVFDKIKKIILFLLRWIRNILILFLGLIRKLFFKENYDNKNNFKDLKKKNIPTNNTDAQSTIEVQQPTTRKINEQEFFFKTEEEIKRKIKYIYSKIFEMKEEYFTDDDRRIIKNIQNSIIKDIIYQINHSKFDNEEKFTIFIEEKMKKEINNLFDIQIDKISKKDRREVIFEKRKFEKKEEVIENNVEDKVSKENFNPYLEVKSDNNLIMNNIKIDSNVIKTPMLLEKECKVMENQIKPEDITIEFEEKEDKAEISDETILNISVPKKTMNFESIIETINDKPSESIKLKENDDVTDEEVVVLEKMIDELDTEIARIEIEIKKEVNEEIKEELKKNEKIQEKEDKEILEKNLKEIKNVEIKYENINLNKIDEDIISTIKSEKIEIEKEDLEDKEYDKIEKRIDALLVEIKKMKNRKISPENLQIIKLKEKQLLSMKERLNIARNHDIKKEESELNEIISTPLVDAIEDELKNSLLEHQIDLQNAGLNKIEELENLEDKNVKKVEKDLIKLKLKRAKRASKITNIIHMPFIRNKYFLYFTSGLLVAKNLNFIDSILKHYFIDREEDIFDTKRGYDALDNALSLANSNLSHLNNIEMQIYFKYPELKEDQEFFKNVQVLKNSLFNRKRKLIKKKKMIEKYNMKDNSKVKVLKKQVSKPMKVG